MNVVITGASRGIGRGIATVLARAGFRVGLLARSADALEALCAEIAAAGGICEWTACDLRDPEAVTAAIDTLRERLGGLDALVNNAGLVIRKDVFDLSLEEWRAMVDTNLTGLFCATRAVLPHFVEQRRGHIVNMSSISGRVPLAGGSGYAATKFAVTGFSQSLFQEVRDHGIKVTVVYSGSVDSRSDRHAKDADSSWKVAPEEVGEAIRDLLRTAPGAVISELEIRPLQRPPRP